MSQAFSLYSELTIVQNLVLHAKLFHVPKEQIEPRVQLMLERFDLEEVKEKLPDDLPLGFVSVYRLQWHWCIILKF